MADFRPLQALRYDPAKGGNPADLVAPPFDVVSEDDRQSLYARSPYNVSRVDYGEERPSDSGADNRYTRARGRIADWLERGVLRRDETARLYVYDQEFLLEGRRLVRRALFGRLRLVEWDKGVVLPHELTGAAPKADRLELLRATRVSLSPIMLMYRGSAAGSLLAESDIEDVVLDARMSDAERHTLRPVRAEASYAVAKALESQRLYVADGHHRYETALTYRDERQAAASGWTGEEPENFVLAALIDVNDPGLVVLPTHRLLRPGRLSADAVERLRAYFDVETLETPDDAGALVRRLADAGRERAAFVALGLEPGRTHLLRARDWGVLDPLLPKGHADVWRRLDVNVLHYAVYQAIGFEPTPETIDYPDDAREAVAAVRSADWPLAFLLNATPLDQVLECSDAGERMPRKSTYFYPKLATGVLMYPLD